MSLSAQGPRPPYPLPPPPGTGRLSSFPATYSSQSFSSQLHQHHHYLSTPSSQQPGFTFPNSMLLPGSQPSVISPAPGTNSSMPLSTSPGQDSNDGLLEASSVPTPRRQSVSSHGSPIPPNSPILEVETPAEYKICNYRSGVSSSAVNSFGISSSAVNSFGINSSVNSFGMSAPPPPPPPPFGSFPSAPQQTPSSLHMPCGLGYPGPPAAMCPTSMYTAQEAMCNGTPPLGLSMWNGYQALPSIGNSMSKLACSLDTPRYKLTPERAIPLIKWFEDHKDHPYPTRHEKLLLCQSTQLTYTQVSTWFANARRRLKKANSEEEESRSNHSSSDECGSQNSLDSPLQ